MIPVVSRGEPPSCRCSGSRRSKPLLRAVLCYSSLFLSIMVLMISAVETRARALSRGAFISYPRTRPTRSPIDATFDRVWSGSRSPGQAKLHRMRVHMSDKPVFKGLGLLEWANAIVPQGALVKTARTSWNLIWKTMMAELAPQSSDGSYVRPTYGFKGQLGTAEFPLEEGRYHIYVGNACPWCHRVTLTHALKGLSQAQVSYSSMDDDPERASRGGWAFSTARPDPLFNAKDLREVYERCQPGYKGRCTAPVMVDTRTNRIVNNESSDLVPLLNLFTTPHPHKRDVDLCPPGLRPAIDAANALTYHKINNGVYRAGFATRQGAYEVAVRDVMTGLDAIEEMLKKTRFLAGDVVTEADVRLLPTLLRFDAVYAPLFLRMAQCSLGQSARYPSLRTYMATLYALPKVRDTIQWQPLVDSYFLQLFPLNPSGLVPPVPSEEALGLLPTPPLTPTDLEAMFAYSSRT